ncbi:hypothetical protein RT97_01485 [Variovorax paradoxus]|uniref:DUF305 domain-containing protein n=1 Tax=Variovorax paradoxus TaxID=34073 RepID=A0A0D0LF98_VARPD|nr:DUF305 domain-containing protein [Variovorax paradoxus]KIQ36837.1 hypothetical protein RT97_01485 [Variovorax paradoxus]
MSATSPRRQRGVALAAVAVAAWVAAAGVMPAAADSLAAAFAAENDAAMNRMMAAMEIKPSGDVDRDFAAMMIPHHQGAIEMAQAELRYGRNEQLRRIAQEIIVEQQQEIAAMHLALGQPLPPSAPAPTQGLSATNTTTDPMPHRHSMPGMHMEHRDNP